MTAINYSDLCAYVARRAADVAQFAVDILGSWGIPADVATAEECGEWAVVECVLDNLHVLVEV